MTEQGDIVPRAIQDVAPILEEALDRMPDITREDALVVRRALVLATIAGVKIGMSEVAAQVVEGGVDLRLDFRTNDLTWDDPPLEDLDE